MYCEEDVLCKMINDNPSLERMVRIFDLDIDFSKPPPKTPESVLKQSQPRGTKAIKR